MFALLPTIPLWPSALLPPSPRSLLCRACEVTWSGTWYCWSCGRSGVGGAYYPDLSKMTVA